MYKYQCHTINDNRLVFLKSSKSQKRSYVISISVCGLENYNSEFLFFLRMHVYHYGTLSHDTDHNIYTNSVNKYLTKVTRLGQLRY